VDEGVGLAATVDTALVGSVVADGVEG
jgi:hypothetical protein